FIAATPPSRPLGQGFEAPWLSISDERVPKQMEALHVPGACLKVGRGVPAEPTSAFSLESRGSPGTVRPTGCFLRERRCCAMKVTVTRNFRLWLVVVRLRPDALWVAHLAVESVPLAVGGLHQPALPSHAARV